MFITCAKRQSFSDDQRDWYQPMYSLAVNHYRGNLQHVQVSQLTNQHPVVTVLGCQSSVCVMYSMCNILGNQLVFLKIEEKLYLWFIWSVYL